MTLWFLARAAGYVALMAASLSVTLGALGSASVSRRRELDPRLARRLDRRILMQLVHRSAAVVTLAVLALHVVLLVVDSYVSVSVAGALVPFTAGYRGVALGLGTLGAYAFLIVAATGALRGRLARSERAAKIWRGIHLASYGAWALAMAHGLLAGTDTGTSWSWALYAGCAAAVLAATGVRLRRRSRHQDREPVSVEGQRRELVSGGRR